MRSAIDAVRENVVHIKAGDESCSQLFGIAPWATVEMPEWFKDPEERLKVWQNQKIALLRR